MTKRSIFGTLSTKISFIEKETDVARRVSDLASNGKYRFLRHAHRRMKQRRVNLYEILQVLKNGTHQAHRDRFNHEFQYWQYTLEGKTLDGRRIRLAVSFQLYRQEEHLIVVTVINLGRK